MLQYLYFVSDRCLRMKTLECSVLWIICPMDDASLCRHLLWTMHPWYIGKDWSYAGIGYTDTKAEGTPRPCDGCRSTKGSMHRKTFSLPLRKTSHHAGIFFQPFSLSHSRIFSTIPEFFLSFPQGGTLDRTVEAKPGIHYTYILCQVRLR